MTDEGTKIRWAPLESNPEVFNTYLGKLGVTTNWVSFYGWVGIKLTWFFADILFSRTNSCGIYKVDL